MKREELIAYDNWLTSNKWGSSVIITPEQAADLYLAEHPLHPAEGAEKPNAKKYLADNGYGSGTNYTTNQVAYLMTEFAALNAQRLAEKMVEDMRQKLFSMRSTKEAMDKLSEADRLMQYGYHDCINEMLMWTKNLSHD